MSIVRIENLVKKFGSTAAVDDVSLEIGDGEFFSLLGSSGCGKTTTLRCVAGLETPTSGNIFIDDKNVIKVPASERDCGMVFQNYALFPHMTVLDNISYGLMAKDYREKGMLGRIVSLFRSVSSLTPAEARKKAEAVLETVELTGYEERLPGQLSGGQQQRVALARAMVTSPRVLLFDEPLGALDAKLRVKMREEIRRIQKKAGITTIYVTHDQEEALSVSDRIAVMNKGKVVQVGAPEDIYLRPRTRFIADFIGLSNIFTASSEGGAIQLEGGPKLSCAPPDKKQFSVALRPESLRLLEAGEESPCVIEGIVQMRMFMGSSVKYTVRSGNLEFVAAIPQADDKGLPIGSSARLGIKPEDLLILEDDK